MSARLACTSGAFALRYIILEFHHPTPAHHYELTKLPLSWLKPSVDQSRDHEIANGRPQDRTGSFPHRRSAARLLLHSQFYQCGRRGVHITEGVFLLLSSISVSYFRYRVAFVKFAISTLIPRLPTLSPHLRTHLRT